MVSFFFSQTCSLFAMFVNQCVRINSDLRWLSQHINTLSDILCFWPERQKNPMTLYYILHWTLCFHSQAQSPECFCLCVWWRAGYLQTLIRFVVQLWVNRQVICFLNGSGADTGMFFYEFLLDAFRICVYKTEKYQAHVFTISSSSSSWSCMYKNVYKVPSWFPVWLIKHGKKKPSMLPDVQENTISCRVAELVDFYSFIHCFIHPSIFRKSQDSCFPRLLNYRHFYRQLNRTCHLSVGLWMSMLLSLSNSIWVKYGSPAREN